MPRIEPGPDSSHTEDTRRVTAHLYIHVQTQPPSAQRHRMVGIRRPPRLMRVVPHSSLLLPAVKDRYCRIEIQRPLLTQKRGLSDVHRQIHPHYQFIFILPLEGPADTVPTAKPLDAKQLRQHHVTPYPRDVGISKMPTQHAEQNHAKDLALGRCVRCHILQWALFHKAIPQCADLEALDEEH